MTASARARFLEHCYERTSSLPDWIEGVTSTLVPVIAEQEGVLVNGGPMQRVPAIASASGFAECMLPFQAALHENAPPGFLEAAYRPFSVRLLSQQMGGLAALWSDPRVRPLFHFPRLTIVDAMGLMARQGDHRIVATVPLRDGHARSDREPVVRQMRRHLQSGLMGALQRTPSNDDIVLDASGRVAHLPQAPKLASKDMLRSAAQAHEAERRGALSDGDAQRVWRQLWEGGWALVDSVDTDGKRMLLLRRDPSNPKANELAPHERFAMARVARGAAYKTIAIELGVAVSIASEIVDRALRKLGFSSRLQFIERVGSDR